MMRTASFIIIAGLLSACSAMPQLVGRSEPEPTATATPVSPPTSTSNLRFGLGYRGSDDPCVRAGHTEITAPYLRSDEDLVGCPIDFEGRPAFIRSHDAREATRTEDWVIYTVPLGNAPVTDFGTQVAITGGDVPIAGG